MLQKASFILALLAAPATSASAQTDEPNAKFWSIGSYAFSIPIGDTQRFADAPSWAGLAWDGQWVMTPRTTLGFGASIHDFYNHSSSTTNFPVGAVTGTQLRDLFAATFSGAERWYFKGTDHSGPYVGLGAGGLFAQQSYQVGVSPQLSRSAWHWLISPEAGAVISLGDGIDGIAAIRFNLPNGGGQYLGGGPRTFSFVTATFGLIEK